MNYHNHLQRLSVFSLSALLSLSACDDSPDEASNVAGVTAAGMEAGQVAGSEAGQVAGQMVGQMAGQMAGSEAGVTVAGVEAGGMTAVSAGMEAGVSAGAEEVRVLFATEAHESEVAFGWVAAGQPSEARLTEVVELGARVISLRPIAEDPFDEQALIEGLGGTFIRYPTTGADYQDPAFRAAMYDLYDAQVAEGGPVYLHCASANRVGASWALYHAERLGVSPEEALEMGRAAGLGSLESLVMEVLGLN